MGPSFETICAYKDHAAMMHYQSTEESDVDVKAEGMLLIDSGGQYYGGTTDVTRTFILGPISEEERKLIKGIIININKGNNKCIK